MALRMCAQSTVPNHCGRGKVAICPDIGLEAGLATAWARKVLNTDPRGDSGLKGPLFINQIGWANKTIPPRSGTGLVTGLAPPRIEGNPAAFGFGWRFVGVGREFPSSCRASPNNPHPARAPCARLFEFGRARGPKAQSAVSSQAVRHRVAGGAPHREVLSR